MAVKFVAPDARSLLPIAGVSLGVAEANIRKQNRKDLLVIKLDDGARVAGVFTQNRFCAAPVVVTRHHLAQVEPGASIRAACVSIATRCACATRGANPTCRRCRRS